MLSQFTRFSPRTALHMTRPGFLSITMVGCLLGFATAQHAPGFSWTPHHTLLATTALLLALLAHAGANVLNDYHDALTGADAANHQGVYPFTGGARLIQNGETSTDATHRLAWTLLGLVVPGGLWLAWQSGWGLVGIGCAGLLLGWAYSAPPLKLMSRGLGETTVAACWWLMVVGADFTLRGHFALAPLASGAGFALLVANILLINGLPDTASDDSVGKRTLAVRLGWTVTARVYAGVAAAAHLWVMLPLFAPVQTSGMVWGLASAPLAWLAYRRLSFAQQPQELRPAIVLTITTALAHGLLVAGGLLLA